jgi:hypothetical protein
LKRRTRAVNNTSSRPGPRAKCGTCPPVSFFPRRYSRLCYRLGRVCGNASEYATNPAVRVAKAAKSQLTSIHIPGAKTACCQGCKLLANPNKIKYQTGKTGGVAPPRAREITIACIGGAFLLLGSRMVRYSCILENGKRSKAAFNDTEQCPGRGPSQVTYFPSHNSNGPDAESQTFKNEVVKKPIRGEGGPPHRPWSSRNFSASRAAMHPVPAAVIACRYRRSCTSPQAKTPCTRVKTLLCVLM